MLDYLSSVGMIKLKWPRDTFGIHEDQQVADSKVSMPVYGTP